MAHLLALLHDLDLLIAHVQPLLQDGGAAVQRSILSLQAAHLRQTNMSYYSINPVIIILCYQWKKSKRDSNAEQ